MGFLAKNRPGSTAMRCARAAAVLLIAACNPAPGLHDPERVCPNDPERLARLDPGVLIPVELLVFDEEQLCWRTETKELSAVYWCRDQAYTGGSSDDVLVYRPSADGECVQLTSSGVGTTVPVDGLDPGTDPYLLDCEARPECCEGAIPLRPFCPS